MRRDTVAVQGFLLECFRMKAMFTLENVLDGRKTENVIARGWEGGCWNKNVRGGKIN